MVSKDKKFILWFDEVNMKDVGLVGGKNASLGEMYQELTKKKINIPYGFAVTAYAYRYLLKKAGVEEHIKQTLKGLKVKDVRNLATRGKKIREIIRSCEFPPELHKAIVASYHKLSKKYRAKNTDVAVRSSATAEDLPEASFAGQQETYLNIHNEKLLINACKNCFASLFTDRAIAYREEKGFDHFKVYLSIGVQKMVRSDRASSGVMFTLDTETGFDNVVFVTSAWGLGENVVQGAVNPDEFHVFDPTLLKGYKPIITKTLGSKSMTMIYAEGKKPVKNTTTPPAKQKQFSISDEEVLKLARWGCAIEKHYSNKKKRWTPMDIEWAKDGISKELYIVQARPETVQSQKQRHILEEYQLKQKGEVIITGKSVGSRIANGTATVIRNVKDIEKFKPGQILVTEMTDPDWVVIMKQAGAIVTDKGGRTCFTGNTIILTNKGFMTFEKIFENYEGLQVLSLNKQTLKIEWKPVIASMKRKSEVIELETSQTGRMKGNKLRLTPDHKMLTLLNRKLISKEIKNIFQDKELILTAQRIPALTASTLKEQKLAYLLGAISTDGHIHTTRTRGEITFIQKPTAEKLRFIKKVNDCLQSTFNKSFKQTTKKTSTGQIRGKKVIGNANAYRCYSKQIAQELALEQESLPETLLYADSEMIYHFLAGVIDGDGSYGKNRINIYCSKTNLLQSIVISCLRLGIAPQITTNRTIYNVQIVEKIPELLKYTQRVKGSFERTRFGTRYFAAKQILGDVMDKVNYKGRMRPYVDNNLLIDTNKIQKMLPMCDTKLKQEFQKIIDSDLRMQRVNSINSLGTQDVYNITVADNHNYLVFTDRYTPILVNNCHAAIVSRELGIPCVVGTLNGTDKIKNGEKITVNCAEGDTGYVHKGLLKYEVKKINIKKFPKTRTKVMMNLGNPDEAFDLSFIPNAGVGLAREEFIINSYIKIHPMALVEYNKVPGHVKKKIDALTQGYKDKKQFFIEQLARGVGTIAAAFYPNDVIVRMSDFKSNEYANLIGGKLYEPKEENPMIGWRGASRYYNPKYSPAFALECRALKKVREEFGLVNMKIMIPFCRTVEEGKKVIAEMRKNGLVQGKNGLQVYMMCEIPSNVVLANEFSKVFDGFSIGTNDLTQLTLGLDRDSALVADLYDERNEAVKDLVHYVIDKAKKNKRKIGLCGDAPGTFKEFAQFLVECGIDSISLSPDAVVKTALIIADMEKRLKRRKK